MKMLNDQFDEYRDCLRITWNYALRHRATGVISFPDVSWSLLQALVLDDLEDATTGNTRRVESKARAGECKVHTSEAYVPSLGAVIRAIKPSVYQPKERSGIIVWESVADAAVSKGSLFYYVDVHDFCDADAMYELEYIKGIASADFGEVRKDSLIIIPRSHVDIVDLTST